MKWVVGFGRFWWDFIVGDSIVLAIGGVSILAIAYALAESGNGLLAQFVLPVAVFATIVASLPLHR